MVTRKSVITAVSAPLAAFTLVVALSSAAMLRERGGPAEPDTTSRASRTYEVSTVRLRSSTPTSVWPPLRDGTTRHVERFETADGRWALETAGLDEEKEEASLLGRLMDSTGQIVWEDTIGDVNYLCPTHPAFLTTSPLGMYTHLYNLEVGTEPLLTFPSGLDDIIWSPDGSAFAVSGAGYVRIGTVAGKMLGAFELPDRERDNICSALSDSGRYFAIGEARMDTTSLKETIPGKKQLKVSYRGVAMFNRSGQLVGQFGMPRPYEWPRCLALSEEIPPRIAVATDAGVSVWSADGRELWQDSLAFGLVDPPHVCAISFVGDNTVSAVTQSDTPPLSYWEWGTNNGWSGRISLPAPSRMSAIAVQVVIRDPDHVEIRTDDGCYLVSRKGGGR